MGHGHSHGHDDVELTPEQKQHQKQALRVLIVALIPLAVATFAALVWMWPGSTAEHIRQDTGTVRVPGTTVQKGTIDKITTTDCTNEVGSFPGDKAICAKLTVTVLDGPDKGQQKKFDINSAVYESGVEPGQKVRMYRVPVDGMTIYSFIDFDRTVPLVFFVGLFALLVVAVARMRGFLSLVGLVFAFWILLQFMMPNLILGKDPLMVGVVASAAIMFVVLYTSHGFTVRTTTALVGTLFGLLVSAVLGVVSTKWSHLTGVVEEDDFMLMASAPSLELTSVVVCGMIVGALGALNDVTITQASAVWELARTERNPWNLYRSAMRIGRDHIASTVYTIAFASAGATLSVLLLMKVYSQPMGEMVVQEMFSGEILRTVIGSIGLMLAVPLTTAVGVFAVSAGRSGGADPVDDDPLIRLRSKRRAAARSGTTAKQLADESGAPTAASATSASAASASSASRVAVRSTGSTDDAPAPDEPVRPSRRPARASATEPEEPSAPTSAPRRRAPIDNSQFKRPGS